MRMRRCLADLEHLRQVRRYPDLFAIAPMMGLIFSDSAVLGWLECKTLLERTLVDYALPWKF